MQIPKLSSTLFLVGSLTCLVSCSSYNVKEEFNRKVILESSAKDGNLPDWTHTSQVGWIDGTERFFKAKYTIRGDQRVNSCFDLAKLELKESVIGEISSELRGQLNVAIESSSEDAETLFNKSFNQEFQAKINGLKFKEQVYERYLIRDVERVDCHILGSIDQNDYLALKNSMLKKVVKASPELERALQQKQAQFFKESANEE